MIQFARYYKQIRVTFVINELNQFEPGLLGFVFNPIFLSLTLKTTPNRS